MHLKERLIRQIAARARGRVADLAGELAHASSEEKETILAAMEFERWLAEVCEEAVHQPGEAWP